MMIIVLTRRITRTFSLPFFVELRYTYRVIALASMLEHSENTSQHRGLSTRPKDMTMLFADIVGFTGCAYGMDCQIGSGKIHAFLATGKYIPASGTTLGLVFFCDVMSLENKVLYQAQEQSKHGSEVGGFLDLWSCGKCGFSAFPSCAVQAGHAPFRQVAASAKKRSSVVEWVLKKGCRPKVLEICGIIKTHGLTLISYPDSCILGIHTDTNVYTAECIQIETQTRNWLAADASEKDWKSLISRQTLASFLGVLDLSWYFLGWSSEQFHLELFDIL